MSLAAIGKGCPDIAVGIFGKTLFFEIKNPNVPARDRMLTPLEDKFRDGWKGHYAVVTSVDEALREAGLIHPKNWKDGKQR